MILIDVRSLGEYAGGHIEGALNIPVEAIAGGNLGALAGVPQDTPVRVYCRSGARAEYARQALAASGFADVENLGGLEEAAAALGV
jgi:phage shock protein E